MTCWASVQFDDGTTAHIHVDDWDAFHTAKASDELAFVCKSPTGIRQLIDCSRIVKAALYPSLAAFREQAKWVTDMVRMQSQCFPPDDPPPDPPKRGPAPDDWGPGA
jgi:hypothetical protein